MLLRSCELDAGYRTEVGRTNGGGRGWMIAGLLLGLLFNGVVVGEVTLVKDRVVPSGDVIIEQNQDNSYTTVFDPDSTNSNADADRGQTFTMPEIAGLKNGWAVREITVVADDARDFTARPDAKLKIWVFQWPSADGNDRSQWVNSDGVADGDPFDGTGISQFLIHGEEVGANFACVAGDFIHFRFDEPLLMKENQAYGFLLSFDDYSSAGEDLRIDVYRLSPGNTYPGGFNLIAQRTDVNSSNELKDDLRFFVVGTVSDTILDADPTVDSDHDLLTDKDELEIYKTDPEKADTDGDGTPDGMEVSKQLDPKNPNEKLERPNIIFILCDDLGYGDLGVLFQNQIPGTKKHFTPHLDTMAQSGIIMNRHYCPAPVCAPSRASLLLGVHQGHANVRDNQFDKALENNFTLASTLKSAGYYTSLIGKYGLEGSGSNPSEWPAYPTKRGFDFFFGYVRHSDGHQHYPGNTWDLGDSAAHRSKKELWDNDTEISGQLDKCYTADLFTARAKKLITEHRQANPNQPFFIYLAYDTPHAALQLPTQAYPDGRGLTGGLQWNGTPGAMINTASGTIDSWRHPDYVGKGWPDKDVRFATSVRRLDDCVGDLIQTLKDLDIDEKTLIVFSSDNGPHTEAYLSGVNYEPTAFKSYGPFDGIKRDTWEGGVRMPTLVRWQGTIGGNRISNQPSQFQDWMATFAELAGWTAPCRSDGVSLRPTLTGAGAQKDGLVYVEYYNNGSTPSYSDFDASHIGLKRNQMQVIFQEGYKGVRYNIQSHDDLFRIYDVNNDPRELTNLAGTSSYFVGLQQKMKDQVLRIRQINSTASRPYDSALVTPVTVPVERGIVWQAYEGLWPWVPEFRDMTPVATGSDAAIGLEHLTCPTDAGLLVCGYIDIPADGDWNFYLSCDTGAHLRIHDSQVIDDDFNHTGVEVAGMIKLAAGLHPFRLYYRSGRAEPMLTLQWSGPGIARQAIPAAVLYRDRTPLRAPGNLSAAPAGGAIELDWDNNPEGDIAGYNVYRTETPGSVLPSLIAAQVTDSSYRDTETMAGQNYYYIVRALDTAWNESEASQEAAAFYYRGDINIDGWVNLPDWEKLSESWLAAFQWTDVDAMITNWLNTSL